MASKELQAIIAAGLAARRRRRPAALVTVVRTEGSTYRRPGARMLVCAAESIGSISGGCLEEDARERAREAIACGQPTLVRYDTSADGDIIFGTGMGCVGAVEVLIQPLAGGENAPPDFISCLAHTLQERRPAAFGVVFAVSSLGSGQAEPGLLGRFLHVDDGNAPSTNLIDPDLAGRVEKDARAILRSGRPGVRLYRSADGQQVHVFIEVLRPPMSLLVCGAGQDAGPLVRLGKELGWRVRVADPRRAYATKERFPDADEIIVCPAGEFCQRVPVEPGEAAVLMNHHFLHDRAILETLLGSQAGYIGVLGPAKRTARLLQEIGAQPGVPPAFLSPKSLRRLHGPAGLDIGAEAPEQIALAIVAEIEAAAAHRAGGRLRRRRGPLHRPAPAVS